MQTQYQYVVGSRMYLTKTVHMEGTKFPTQTAEEYNTVYGQQKLPF
jgi:hypothetical protein